MSSWVALNVEPDETVEEEVDNTKEIQVEEALKLYQNALKLHSQGPQFYAEAAGAYDALLKSDIFKSPEPFADYARNALQDTEIQSTGFAEHAAEETLPDIDINDSTSSTLFQTIHLSYKNYGQYLLDALQDLLKETPQATHINKEFSEKVSKRSISALSSFANALERDDTDLDIWRKSARLSSALQSYRLTRYCLESVLADDENRLEMRTEQLGLDETCAEECLRETLLSVDDKLWASQVPLKKPRKALLKFLRRQIDPYPYLPRLPADQLSSDSSKSLAAIRPTRHTIRPNASTWLSVGEEILQTIINEGTGVSDLGSSAAIDIFLPGSSIEPISPTVEEPTHPHEDCEGTDCQNRPERQLGAATMENGNKNTAVESPSLSHVQKTELTLKSPEDHAPFDLGAEKQLVDFLESLANPSPDMTNQQENAKVDEPETKQQLGTARKRSSTSVANEDHAEGGRMKSRRTRARESNTETLPNEDLPFDQTKYYEDRLQTFFEADNMMFGLVSSLLSRVGVEELGTIGQLRRQTSEFQDGNALAMTAELQPAAMEPLLCSDLRSIVSNWNERSSQLAREGDPLSAVEDLQGMNKFGLTAFLEHSKKSTRRVGVNKLLSGDEGLRMFLSTVSSEWMNIHELAFRWLQGLLLPGFGEVSTRDSVEPENVSVESTYITSLWPDALKEIILKVLSQEDEYIYKRIEGLVTNLGHQILNHASGPPFKCDLRHFSELEMIESIFELHLDLYAQIDSPNSEVDQSTRVLQRNSLERWSMLARTSLAYFLDHGPAGKRRNYIALRHLWASTFHTNIAANAPREHVLLCLRDLKFVLQSIGSPVIHLPNSSVMPEVSVSAIDKEASKLKSMDFFLRVFDPASKDPVDIIENIEPILEPSSIEYAEEQLMEEGHQSFPELQEMRAFLDRGDATLRLFLWRKLQDAYQVIDYPPKVISCCLRSIETIVKQLWNPSYTGEESVDERQMTLLKWLKSLDAFLKKTITLVFQDPEKAYECIDNDHLKSSMSTVARLLRLLHSFTLYEDSVRVGQTPAPELRVSLTKSLEAFRERLREMQVNCWILQYTFVKEAISQNTELFDTPSEDCIQYLCLVHNAFGIRSMCKYSNKRFLKLMKSELFALGAVNEYESETCQVLFDLYGVKFSSFDGVTDHGCAAEKLDRATAVMMIDFVMRQARRLSMKDLPKSELKNTIDKMQQVIGMSKASSSFSFNRRVLTSYLKLPIDPTHLFRALQGIGDLSMITIPPENAKIANKGWYFLLGCVALTKFRSQKRLSPVPTTDLDDAVSYFRQDLEHGTGRWESWYRLAQTYDSKLEEDLTWSAEKINNNKSDLVGWQRCAIRCYAMAVATAIRTMEPTPENRVLLSDLYTDFAIRMYASSREPLSMAVFSLSDYVRHFSKEENQEMYKGPPFEEMKSYSVWNFSSYLLKRAIVDQPKRWMNYYMLGKCLWKMFSCDESVRGSSKCVELDNLLDTLLDAIYSLPQRKDTRSDPIFEPHFKLVSIVHKLVQRGILSPTEGSETLQATPWARKVQPPQDSESWGPYILEVLKRLKSADKSNWHHRIPVRAAHVIYDNNKDATAAAAAKQELTQQIFTKTMTIQVWKPEFERPGRHFVYTTRYAYFFVNLLDQLDDRASLDQLLRRVRKRQGDFINHTKLWEDICLTYFKVARRIANVKEGYEEGIFKPMGWDDFVQNTARLENLPEMVPESTFLLELMRDVIEMKKLNNHLMRVTMFEDLIADLYARLYEIHAPRILEQANEENKEKMKVDHIILTGQDGAADTPPTSLAPAPPAESLLPPQPRGRTKGIARRDIQKRAEAIMNKKLTPRATSSVKTSMTVETEVPRPSIPAAAPSTEEQPAKDSPREIDESGSGQQGSTQNSIHDSADDESELSEIDDEGLSKLERKALSFPNLTDRTSPDHGSEFSAPASVEGEDAEVEAHGYGEGEGEGDGDDGADGNLGQGDDTEAVTEERDGEETEAEAEGDEDQEDDEEEEEEEEEEGDEGGGAKCEGADNEEEEEGKEGNVEEQTEAGTEVEDRKETEAGAIDERQPAQAEVSSTPAGEPEPEPMDTSPAQS